MYWNAKCHCKLWNIPWLCCVFFVIINKHLCLKGCLFTKLSDYSIIWYVNMSDVTAGSRKLSDLNVFFKNFLWQSSSSPCSHYFCNFLQQKKGFRPKWTIYKHVSYSSKKYMSICNSVCCLCSVVCSASAAYTSLYIGLQYLLKV